jgi:hypothetical protein
LIPGHLVPKLAREYGVAAKARTFCPWSHVVSLIYSHLVHAVSLNDVCDALHLRSGPLSQIRGVKPPCRNTFSHANKVRNPEMAQALYWSMLDYFTSQFQGFSRKPLRSGFLRRFRKLIHAVDSTTIPLVANALGWAKHRRRKAAAKCHLRLNLQTFLPGCAIIDPARHHDSTRVHELCAALQPGEIVVFDKAYCDFEHLFHLQSRGVFWVTRAKDNMSFRRIRKHKPTHASILCDEEIQLVGFYSKSSYPEILRRITAMVEVDGKLTKLTFLTNNLEWSAWTVAELYRARWEIEVFFKEIKQTLQLADFLGNNASAVRWQIWIGLLVHLLLRFQAWLSQWAHSFSRLFTLLRAGLWLPLSLPAFLDRYGTATAPPRFCAHPDQSYLPGLFPNPMG